jgi:hypothetical protein
VAAGGVHEELQWVEGARGRRRRRLRRRGGGADDDVALVEGGPERRDLVVGQLVLVGKGLELALLDEAALRRLLEQAVGRRQIVQVRVSQWNRPSFGRWAAPIAGPEAPAQGEPAMCRSAPVSYL